MTTNPSSLEGLKLLEDQLTCPICLNTFTSPRILPCFHSFCLDCLNGIPLELANSSHYLSCPTCRSSCSVPDNGLASLPPSFVINNLIDVYSLLKKVSSDQNTSCDNCNENNANRYCKQCEKFICPQCLHFHDNWKSNIGHETISLEEVASTVYQLPRAKPDAIEHCTDHNKPFEIFCETCDQLICHNCTVRKHRDHDYDVVSDTYSKHEDEITKSSIQPLHQERDRLADDKMGLVNRIDKVTMQADKTDDEINQIFTKLRNHLDEKERQLKGKVALAKKHKVGVLQQQLKDADTSLGLVTECIDHVEQCMKIATPHQLLSTKSQMMNRAESVLKQVKDKSFKPVEQADIKLVKNSKVNELHNNIGNVTYTTFSSAKVVVTRRHIPLVEHKSTVPISFSLPDGSLVPIPPSCSLSPPDNGRPIQCIVKESSQSGQYNVMFTPVTRGQHQLHATISGITVPGSPVNIPVTGPRNKPIRTIDGLKTPSGVAVTKDGLLVVSEHYSHCITILNKERKRIQSIGSPGNGRGQLKYPQGVAITSKGTILVADNGNHRIQEYTMEGDCISCIGTKGNGSLQFLYPRGIAINKTTGQVFVADEGNHRVQVLKPNLKFSHSLYGKNLGQGYLDCPYDISIDTKGFVYVTDGNHCIKKFSPHGQFVSNIAAGSMSTNSYPSGITIDDNDLVYVNSIDLYTVTVYTTTGEHVDNINKNISCLGYYFLHGITHDNNTGLLYVCCYGDNVIKIF